MNREEYAQKVEEIEISSKEAKEVLAKAEGLERLYKNRDFKKIFMEGYFKEEASRLVMLRADGSIRASADADKTIKMIDDKIIAIGELRQYLNMLSIFGDQAKQALEENEEYLNDLTAEMNG